VVIGPGVEARFEDLLVQTCAVEAHRLCDLDVTAQIIIRGCGPDPVRMEALVEHETQVARRAVEQEAVAVDLHRA
jgi:hypothetical protein